ncbi:MAG: integrase family protein, partial [bacterium]|nr:integrase family protein [bacterium]
VLRSIPVCVVSAEAQAPVRATRFLRKPFDLVSLVEIVTEVFERPRCHRCPSETGTLRVPSSVQKAWRRALKAAGIKRGFTVHGLRRTFNDLARRAGVDAVVTRAMTGHVTERMREHYSTVVLDEKRSAMTNVLQLVCGGVADEASGGAAEAEQGGGAGGCGDRPHAGAHGGADEAQIQQRPVGLGGANRA